jgi:TfoX/Sxy family transcriptional regulator of competence genes
MSAPPTGCWPDPGRCHRRRVTVGGKPRPDLTCLYYSYGITNGILLCRAHHRAKRRDGWWPTLHPDGTVAWAHADGRTRSDPPPTAIDDHITTLLNGTTAANTADHADGAGPGYRSAPAGSDTDAEPTTAGETRGTCRTGHPPPQPPLRLRCQRSGRVDSRRRREGAMAYDEALAERVREILAERIDVTERRMFGGLAFMVGGHMACGIIGSDLMVRVGKDGYDDAIRRPHTREMDFTGRPTTSMVYVDPGGTADDRALRAWVERAVAFTDTLHAK